MKHLILTLIFALAATTSAQAAGGKNIGLLIEWIQVDHHAANQLLHQFGDEDNATALRAELETRLDQGEATLVETSYLVSTSGMRAKVESLREHIYPTEYDPEELSFVPGKLKAPNLAVSPGALGILTSASAYDIRDLGTSIEIEPILGHDGKMEFHIEATRTEHLSDRPVGDPKLALNGTMQPTFRESQTSTAFIARDGEDFLLDVLTPKNGSDQRVFLIIRANILRPDPMPGTGQINFTRIPAGSTLTVDFHSTGCFHNTSTRYEFTGEEVAIYQLAPKLIRRGTVQLADADLKKLDKTLAFYYDTPSGGCTTIEKISFTLREGEKIIAHENYIDGSCSIDEQKGLLRFGELDLRLK